MKSFLLATAGLMASCGNVFCQCSSPGLKVQSGACEGPQNLKVRSVSCTEMRVDWTGNKNQTYVVKASYTDPGTGAPVETASSKNTSDEHGNFGAGIDVREGIDVRWSVQAVCSVEKATVYSAEVMGEDTRVPVCRKGEESASGMYVYPNPASDYLNVKYAGNVEGAVAFRILDVAGKKVLHKLDGTVAKTNGYYTLDVRGLPPGTYLLEAASGSYTSQAKFVLLRN